MVGHVERFNPAVAKLRSLVAEGRLGHVYRAHTTRVGPLPSRIQDTGVAIDLATHDLDVMQHVLGTLDRRDLRRRRPLHAQLPGGPADLPGALRREPGPTPTPSGCSTSTG